MCSHCYKCIFGPSVCRLCQKPWNSFPTLRRSFPTIWLKFFKCEGSGWQRTWQLLLGVVLCWGRGHPPSSPVLAPPFPGLPILENASFALCKEPETLGFRVASHLYHGCLPNCVLAQHRSRLCSTCQAPRAALHKRVVC